MKASISRSLRFRFMALILLALLPALALSLYSATQQREELIDQTRQEATLLTHLAADNYDNLIAGAHQLLITLSTHPDVLNAQADTCPPMFDELVSRYPTYSSVIIAEPNGDVTCPVSETGELLNVADREYFQDVMETREFTIGKYVVGRVSGRPIVVLSMPILDEDGNVTRIVAISLTVTWLGDVAHSADLPDDSVLLMVQRDGTILARYPEVEGDVQDEAAAPVVRTLISSSAESSTLDTVGLDGIERLYAFTQLTSETNVRDAYLLVGFQKGGVVAPANRLLVGYLLALGLAAFLGIGAVWIGGNRFLMRPVDTLLDAANRLSTGDLSTRVGEFKGPDEFHRLASAFDTMAGQLERRDAERRQDEAVIRQLNTELEDRVAERTAQLEATNRELEAFTYSVSHDLRAPLRAIDGFSRIVVNEYAEQLPDEGRRYLSRVRDAAQRMGQLIDDLLAFSRLSRQPMAMQTVSPATLVTQVLDELNGELEGREVEIVVGDLPVMHGDAALLRQVFSNLLGNAIKFTKNQEHARVEVGMQSVDGEDVYFVKDNGAGFDMRYADKLFGVFQRLHHVEDYEGTGVGLATVQRIIHRHGGTIWAEAAVDQGATFYFTLGGHAI